MKPMPPIPGEHPLLTEARNCCRDAPEHSLALSNQFLEIHPDDPDGLESRHNAWLELGRPDLALNDVNAALAVRANSGSYFTRALVYRALGDHEHAIDDLTRSHQLDDGVMGFMPLLFRADSLSQLGRLDEAMADCAHIPEDYWAPRYLGLPGGNKAFVVQKIRKKALGARNSNRKKS